MSKYEIAVNKTSGGSDILYRWGVVPVVFIKKMSKTLDNIAGGCIVAVTFLIVLNIILRTFFKTPILGTYEYVSLFTMLIISFGLAWCALQNGHIAIEFILEKFSKLTQNIIETVSNSIIFVITILSSRALFTYAKECASSGMVSPTTQIPFHYFIFATAVSFVLLGSIFLIKAVNALKEVARNGR